MPNKVVLEKKQQIVNDLVEMLKKSAGGVVVNYQGITVEDDTKLRKALREAGVKYCVVKNTLTERACTEVGMADMKPCLNGMTAIAIGGEDPVAPAKVLKDYDEKIESFKIVGGYLDGKVVDIKTVMELADIPNKETLIAKFLGSIQSPIYKFAYAIKAVADKMGEAQGEAAPAEAPAEA